MPHPTDHSPIAPASSALLAALGIVVIGRNEGERLKRCLRSVLAQTGSPEGVVYVDSGSSDDSVAFARSLGVEVVDLDLSTPFTAARARNAGVARLLEGKGLRDGGMEGSRGLDAGTHDGSPTASRREGAEAMTTDRLEKRTEEATPQQRASIPPSLTPSIPSPPSSLRASVPSCLPPATSIPPSLHPSIPSSPSCLGASVPSCLSYLQFIDGDCELRDGWLARGMAELEARPDVAVVFGRVRERHPEASIYNRLADMEWDGVPGEVKYCGGIAMMRRSVFEAVGGFDPTLIAGEEPELCVRIRRQGGKVLRLAEEMCWHDMAMTRFSQWWKRAVRGGHGTLEHIVRNGRRSDRAHVKRLASSVFWAAVIPLATVGLLWPTRGLSAAWILLYPVQWWRIASREPASAANTRERRLHAAFLLVAKFAELVGAARYLRERALRREIRLIEHKIASASAVRS